MAETSPNERLLREIYPGRATLSAEDLAELLMGSRNRGVANGIRDKLRNEDLIPGLRKVGGEWRIPITSAARVLDDLTAQPPPAPAKRSRRAAQGPIFLLRRQRAMEFMEDLLNAILFLEAKRDRQALGQVAADARGEEPDDGEDAGKPPIL